jgi:hypothetical protein
LIGRSGTSDVPLRIRCFQSRHAVDQSRLIGSGAASASTAPSFGLALAGFAFGGAFGLSLTFWVS